MVAANHLQVGAIGDSGSVGDNGVEADIRTHVYALSSFDSSASFWVGDDLAGGGFVQFGYEILSPGYYCLRGSIVGGQTQCTWISDTVGIADARWFWEYWPQGSGNDYYYGLGPAGSVCCEGTWHTYSITPGFQSVGNPLAWDFVLDGRLVDAFPSFGSRQSGGFVLANLATSTDPVYVIAEKTTSSSLPGNLGPVEFRNLGYLKGTTWYHVSSLYAKIGCSIVNPTCAGLTNPYGVSLNGPNDILAGSGQNEVLDGTVLWMGSPSFTLQVPSQVQVTLDGVPQELGTVQLTLPIGVHYVTVPNLVQVNNETRLRFVEWTVGVQTIFGPNITINLHSNYQAQAIYVAQYKLTLAASSYSPESEGWYDSGSLGNYSISNQFLPIIFVGWFDESGNLITTSTSGTILMDAPHTVVPEWRVNYALIATYAALVIAIAFLGIFWRRSRKKSGKRHHGWLLSPLEHDR
jgi:hypothetical protein